MSIKGQPKILSLLNQRIFFNSYFSSTLCSYLAALDDIEDIIIDIEDIIIDIEDIIIDIEDIIIDIEDIIIDIEDINTRHKP